jgi:hypothetical protein
VTVAPFPLTLTGAYAKAVIRWVCKPARPSEPNRGSSIPENGILCAKADRFDGNLPPIQAHDPPVGHTPIAFFATTSLKNDALSFGTRAWVSKSTR